MDMDMDFDSFVTSPQVCSEYFYTIDSFTNID
jgi:hypothetical protein